MYLQLQPYHKYYTLLHLRGAKYGSIVQLHGLAAWLFQQPPRHGLSDLSVYCLGLLPGASLAKAGDHGDPAPQL